jgi:hypothetical protein
MPDRSADALAKAQECHRRAKNALGRREGEAWARMAEFWEKQAVSTEATLAPESVRFAG